MTAGLLYGAVFVALESDLRQDRRRDYTAFHGSSAWLVHFTVLLPALIGIGLGRNPSGFLGDAFDAVGRRRSARPSAVFVGGIAVEVLVWFLAFRHTINNWVVRDRHVRVARAALPRVATASVPPARARGSHGR